ncbi:hypothetical protein DL98DRAFT_624996 [Cadophora sp. DSE1049]|nr:hypothetical protein DL98DRAFT_624996 [Cadophora sp. DSE1049]
MPARRADKTKPAEDDERTTLARDSAGSCSVENLSKDSSLKPLSRDSFPQSLPDELFAQFDKLSADEKKLMDSEVEEEAMRYKQQLWFSRLNAMDSRKRKITISTDIRDRSPHKRAKLAERRTMPNSSTLTSKLKHRAGTPSRELPTPSSPRKKKPCRLLRTRDHTRLLLREYPDPESVKTVRFVARDFTFAPDEESWHIHRGRLVRFNEEAVQRITPSNPRGPRKIAKVQITPKREFTHQSLLLDLAVAIGKLEFVANFTMSVDQICKYLPLNHIKKLYDSDDDASGHFTSSIEARRNATRTEVLIRSSQTTGELVKRLKRMASHRGTRYRKR